MLFQLQPGDTVNVSKDVKRYRSSILSAGGLGRRLSKYETPLVVEDTSFFGRSNAERVKIAYGWVFAQDLVKTKGQTDAVRV